ncbi:TPA: DUF1310 family protein [Streptococcus suis]|nr:DUF1310 family protein [Streptococcus suis]HEM3627690.1 DUF1310 family protein [Streptococcus suis]HEM3632167.1 DUF1310 family protein [Streptococcus suis]HEM3640862.1 DUF1310 family protein [Streptococcus suis]HEM3645323.1 DUF1310 family protein [Streptococcus suis]
MKIVVKILVGIIIATVIGIGGFKLMQKIEHNQMVDIVKSEEVRGIIEDDLLEMDKTALTETGLIKSYKIDEESIRHNPMGGINFTVSINERVDLYVDYTIDKNSSTGEIEYSSGAYSSKLIQLLEGVIKSS